MSLHSSSMESHSTSSPPMVSQKVGRHPMPEQGAAERRRNFLEVPLGYSLATAQAEAARCLQCKRPACIAGCPVNVDIPGFLALLASGDVLAAARKVKETNALPAVCGRVCPQESQCEIKCILTKKYESVAIGRCERFVADFQQQHEQQQSAKLSEKSSTESPTSAELPTIPNIPKNGKRIAVVGAGPAGLTVAGDMILLGYDVTVFEAFHKPGGVLMYGIPEFRLPKQIVETEVNDLRKLGVRLELNVVVGKTVTIDELLKEDGYDAVFVGVGAGLPMFLGVPGEDLGGVVSANEYLTRTNLMKAFRFPEYDTPISLGRRVCVIGGGNVAMDAARSALRLGAESVQILYRRSRDELPARGEEIHHAEEEGVGFRFLTNPVEFIGDQRACVKAVRCVEMVLGEPDKSGRRRPIPKPDSDFIVETDCVIIAAGALANPLLTKSTPDMNLNKWGYLVCTESGRTSKPRVWAGGDIVTGSATVILAMGAGRTAAKDMHDFLSQQDPHSPWETTVTECQ